MSAREWLRDRLTSRALRIALDDIARLAAARADALHVAEKLGKLLDERTVERDQALTVVTAVERERDAWRRQALDAPLTPVGDEDATVMDKVRRDWVERTGGR